MLQSVNIRLPQPVFEQLQQVAQREQRSIADTVKVLIVNSVPFPTLQDEIEREIATLTQFPNEVLVLLARHPFPLELQEELADLSDKAQRFGELTQSEDERSKELLDMYQDGILRRSYCMEILRRRGYDLTDLLRLPAQPVL